MGKSETKRTGEEWKKSMNEIFLFLNFIIELEEDFEDRDLPTMNTKQRVSVNGILTYIFYEKPTAANVMVQRTAALGESSRETVQ